MAIIGQPNHHPFLPFLPNLHPSMILADIRYLVGVHLGEKGLPPTVIAPVNNILSLLDEELSLCGFTVSNTIEKEIERLRNAIVLLNYDPSQDDDDSIEEDLAIEDMLEDEEEDEEEDDDIDFGDDTDED